MESSYKIRLALAVPLAFAFLFLLILLVMIYTLPVFPGERIVVTVVFLIVSYLMVEIFSRRISCNDEFIHMRRFLRSKELAWNEITHLGSLTLGKKVYLLLTTTRGFYTISNNYDRFPELLRRLEEKIGAGKMEEGLYNLLERPWKNNKPVYSAWFAVVMLLSVICLRFYYSSHY